jgi:hypothetical protein
MCSAPFLRALVCFEQHQVYSVAGSRHGYLISPYVHDFGSILNFTEWALGKNQQPLHFQGQPINSGISPSYAYADFLAPDTYTSNNCIQSVCPYSLSDFFNFNQTPTTFTPIPLPLLLQGL